VPRKVASCLRCDGSAGSDWLTRAICVNDQMIVSPMQSPPWLLAELPPLMLVIGARDMLLSENLAFAQKVQGAGAAAQVEVFPGMWHDFVEESLGCGAHGHLVEGVTAVERVGQFFSSQVRIQPVRWVDAALCTGAADLSIHRPPSRSQETCRVVCERGKGCSGAAPVNWHFHTNVLPMASSQDCKHDQ
jgi:hypothetical protein